MKALLEVSNDKVEQLSRGENKSKAINHLEGQILSMQNILNHIDTHKVFDQIITSENGQNATVEQEVVLSFLDSIQELNISDGFKDIIKLGPEMLKLSQNVASVNEKTSSKDIKNLSKMVREVKL